MNGAPKKKKKKPIIFFSIQPNAFTIHLSITITISEMNNPNSHQSQSRDNDTSWYQKRIMLVDSLNTSQTRILPCGEISPRSVFFLVLMMARSTLFESIFNTFNYFTFRHLSDLYSDAGSREWFPWGFFRNLRPWKTKTDVDGRADFIWYLAAIDEFYIFE